MKIRVAGGKVRNPEGIEVNAALHCNMRCTSCSHLAPLFRREFVDPAATYDSLARLAKHYHAAYTKILGGEPLLHPDLVELIEAVRASGVSDVVLVCTNGVLLDRMAEEFWRAVDALEISIYPSRTPPAGRIRMFAGLAREHDVQLTVNYYDHFRIAYSENGTDSAPLVQRIFDSCKLAHYWHSHTLHEGWLYRCPQSVVLPRHLDEGWDGRVDGLEIRDDPRFLDDLVAFLNRRAPLRACSNCIGSVGRLVPHAETRPRDWRQVAPTEEVVDFVHLRESEEDITVDNGCVRPSCPVGDDEAEPRPQSVPDRAAANAG
jgi:radical SAM family protein/4Fe-4S single cluster protein